MTAHDLPATPKAHLRAAEWTPLASRVLDLPADGLADRAATASFVALGGTSLRAVELVALAERALGRRPDIGALLGPEPLAEVLAAAAESEPVPEPASAAEPAGHPRPLADGLRPVSPGEQSMLVSDQLFPSAVHHLLFSAEVHGPLDTARLDEAVRALTARHAALRTVFTERDGEILARVLPHWLPRVVRQRLRPAGDAVAAVHEVLAPASRQFLDPFSRPAAVFVVTSVGPGHHVVTLLVHHALADGWSIGILWRELFALYRGDGPAGPAPVPALAAPAGSVPAAEHALENRLRQLAGAPTTVELPSDLDRPPVVDRRGARLRFTLGPAAHAACLELGRTTGLTRNAVLLAAWSFVIGRRAGTPDLLIGMASAGRTTAAEHGAVGLLTTVQPVRCRPEPDLSAREFLGQVGADCRAALGTGTLPAERIVSALGAGGDLLRNPLTQFAFAAHDELLPSRLTAPGLTVTLHEGHCGGTVFDAILYVQHWDAAAELADLAVEYATSVLRPDEAAALAEELDAVLLEFARHPDRPLADIRAGSGPVLNGPEADADAGLWQLFEEVSRAHPDAVAVADAASGRTLPYRGLRRAAERQSALLRQAGVGAGDHVALAHRRSVHEIVSVLAALRLGAAYVSLDEGTPPALAEGMLRSVRPAALLGEPERLAALAPALAGLGTAAVAVTDPWQPDDAETDEDAPGRRGSRTEPPAPADPSRIAYTAFTSGSTGVPKGVRIPHRAVVRLVRDCGFLVPGAVRRFLRYAPLAFDASTLEVFAPLLAGGTVEIYPEAHVVPSDFRDFLRERDITGLWLTAGLFRLVADHEPSAFRTVRQVLTGGDVVPPAQVRAVLEAAPGLVVTNGYGPTENTTFTTVHHVGDPAEVEDPLPIGQPVPGTSVLVLNEAGRPVPPGAVGELCAAGQGLAVDYLDAPEETARAFLTTPEGRYYRTGDLVRQDRDGRLRYLGRRDGQVKIRGFRVELAAVAAVLRDHPAVSDAVVLPTPGPGERRLVAALVATGDESLVPALLAHAQARLPGYAVPALWTVVDAFPVTANGKVDGVRLASAAAPAATRSDAAPVTKAAPNPASGPARAAEAADRCEEDDAERDTDTIADTIAEVWEDVLGTDDFGYDERFFDVGGDSLQLVRVRNSLLRLLPWCDVTVLDLLAHPTVDALAAHLATRSGE